MIDNPDITRSESKGSALSRATDPEATVWVSANAGSGKTYVLSRRVIRLLLEGARPSELLCLTFTKVAASEMANKVFEILGEWALLSDEDLAKAITDLTGRPVIAAQLRRARHLFATALDTPGGLRIQTIHAFCEALLHQFPLEANIPGHFELMDDTDQSILLEEARRRVILAGLQLQPDRADAGDRALLGKAFRAVQEHASDKVIDDTIAQMIGQRGVFYDWVESGGGSVEKAFERVWNEFGLNNRISEAMLYKEFSGQTSYGLSDMADLSDALACQTGKKAPLLHAALGEMRQETDPQRAHALRCAFFLTSKGEPRKNLISVKFMEDHALSDVFEAEQELLQGQINRLKSLKVLQASEAMFTIVDAILTYYGNLKQRKGLLDFDDLIAKTANLLGRSEISGWIQYKLDAGIRHVLVDEAQDTSPLQWQIIEAVTREFYAGQGIERGMRTLFVVGDEKQSIYSFQGADPEEFARQFKRVMKAVENAGQQPDKVPLTVSYRSTEEILTAVDQVFCLDENRKGLAGTDILQTHSANRGTDRGEVFIWPLERKPKKQIREDWLAPLDQAQESDAEIRLANRIASTIKGWIDRREILPGRERPIRHGDILILVRKRDRFVPAINRALKKHGLVSAGADRLKLTEHIAVEDMIALGRFAASPLDDLSLAGLLKSPLFGFGETELYDIAHGRGDKTLMEVIDDRGSEQGDNPPGSVLAETKTVLRKIISTADKMPVYEFYARIFAAHGLREKYLSRLGHEVDEILDGFLQAALDYDNRGGLGITGFVEWLASSSPELKREIDMESDEIRVITVHSSKGLEAPIVFLVDPGSKAFNTSHAPKVVMLEHGPGDAYPLWQSKTAFRLEKTAPVFEKIGEKAEEEYRRLLYVGMTRAADRLIVCGYGTEEIRHDHWHSMILAGLNSEAMSHNFNGRLIEHHDETGQLSYHQWVIDNPAYKARNAKAEESADNFAEPVTPDWFGRAKPEPVMQRPLSPSGVLSMLDIAPETELDFSGDSELPLIRGNLTHQLFQALPELPEGDRAGFAEKWFERARGDGGVPFGNEIRIEILASVTSVLEVPELKPLFAEGSRAEVEIAGTLELAGRQRKIRGKIDRLAVTEDSVYLADYKTNRIVPASPDGISEQYLAQMALYRDLMAMVYPDKRIRPMIIWTRNAHAMAIPDELLDRQMERLNRA